MILITNDDGYTESAEILMSAAKNIDKKVVGIFPERQRSAVGKSMTFHKPARVNKIKKDVYVINGTPADCVYFAFVKYKPKLILSGINLGDNASIHSIYSSGTVGGAIEGALFSYPAVAFSRVKKGHWKEPDWAWKDREILEYWVSRILKRYRPKKREILNVNFPEKLERDSKIVFAKPQKHRFIPKVVKRVDPDGMPYYWLTGEYAKPEKNHDVYYLEKGFIVITRLYVDGIVSNP